MVSHGIHGHKNAGGFSFETVVPGPAVWRPLPCRTITLIGSAKTSMNLSVTIRCETFQSFFKQVFFVLLVMGLITLCGESFASGPDFNQEEAQYISEQKRITIGILADDEPYSFIKHGQYKGYSHDILENLSAISGLKFDYRMGNWSEIYASFIQGKLDAIDAISYNDERSKTISFTKPYTTRKTVVFSRADNPIHSFESADQKPLRVGIIHNIYYQDKIEALPNIEVVKYHTYQELMKSLAFGWIDIVVASEFTGLYTSRFYSLSNITVAGPVEIPGIEEEDFRLGVLKTNPVLHHILHKSVEALAEETKEDIAKRWLHINNINTEKVTKLTEREQRFLRNHPVISIGMIPDYAPFSFFAHDDVYGYTRSLLDLISSYSGLHFQFVVRPWYELINDLKNGQLDAVADMSFTQERSGYALFTDAYYRIPVVVFVRDDFGPYDSLDSLKGKRVGITKDIFYADYIKGLFGGSIAEFTKQDELMRSLAFGKVEAVICSLNTAASLKQELGLLNLRVAGEITFPSKEMEDLRFGVNPRFPELRAILGKSMARITQEEKQVIEEIWLSARPKKQGVATNVLTEEEAHYIRKHGRFSVCVDTTQAPFSKRDKHGHIVGVIPDFLEFFEESTGVQMQITPLPDDPSRHQFLKDGGCDLAVLDNSPSFGLSESMVDAGTFFSTPYVIATSIDDLFITDLKDVSGKSVGVIKDWPLYAYLNASAAGIELIPVKNDEEGIAKLRDGTIYGYAGSMLGIGYQIQQKRISDIKISGRISKDINLAIWVKKSDPLLTHIFQKAVANVREKDRMRISSAWMNVRFEQAMDHRTLWEVTGVFFLVIIGIGYRSGKLKRLNNELNEANEKLLHLSNHDQLTGLYNRHYFVNHAAENFNICKRNRMFFSIAMIDIDHFKKVNDTYGHGVGDECLKYLANTLMKYFQRQTDTVVRYGGEEFIVYFAGDIQNKLSVRMEKVRDVIETQELDFQGIVLSLKICAGVFSKIPREDETLDLYLTKADNALYQAKSSGRNRVVSEREIDGHPLT